MLIYWRINRAPSRPNQTISALFALLLPRIAFLAKFSKSSSRMTNEKFSMTDFQFRLSALVAACCVVVFILGAPSYAHLR